jgi:hypothetical protein
MKSIAQTRVDAFSNDVSQKVIVAFIGVLRD